MTTPGRARRPASFEDLLTLPDHVVGEIVDGELHVSPRPSARHALAASMLSGELGPPFHGRGRGPGGWWILFEPELHLGPDALVPDLAGWRRERMPTVPDVAYFTLPPDWICEVLTPQTGRLDRAKKLPAYAREGVRHAWLIDPNQKTLEVMRLESSRWTIVGGHGGGDTVRAEPFDAIELTLSALWPKSLSPDAAPLPRGEKKPVETEVDRTFIVVQNVVHAKNHGIRTRTPTEPEAGHGAGGTRRND